MNDADERARVVMWSTIVTPSATAYPDSDKIGLWTGIRAENVMVKRSSNVGYWEGETLSGKRQLATMITTSVASASSPAATLRTKTQVGSTPT